MGHGGLVFAISDQLLTTLLIVPSAVIGGITTVVVERWFPTTAVGGWTSGGRQPPAPPSPVPAPVTFKQVVIVQPPRPQPRRRATWFRLEWMPDNPFVAAAAIFAAAAIALMLFVGAYVALLALIEKLAIVAGSCAAGGGGALLLLWWRRSDHDWHWAAVALGALLVGLAAVFLPTYIHNRGYPFKRYADMLEIVRDAPLGVSDAYGGSGLSFLALQAIGTGVVLAAATLATATAASTFLAVRALTHGATSGARLASLRRSPLRYTVIAVGMAIVGGVVAGGELHRWMMPGSYASDRQPPNIFEPTLTREGQRVSVTFRVDESVAAQLRAVHGRTVVARSGQLDVRDRGQLDVVVPRGFDRVRVALVVTDQSDNAGAWRWSVRVRPTRQGRTTHSP